MQTPFHPTEAPPHWHRLQVRPGRAAPVVPDHRDQREADSARPGGASLGWHCGGGPPADAYDTVAVAYPAIVS
eukprot:CAMPEP_0185528826 /NCGR_PEP_ID=MMETSP1366-20130426/99686_1 /TAXON_ID=38817 /ORGANISM="Gephyrocapsa oceanica, Strain RCC1303" /LENGTH=72 /DNA_ID=CAMNT_0028140391 /DNA_START=60 /DNA_END=276 /DNA_ORIENTATION=+